jgi:tetratricopeptide (TPR) repeat protein
MRNEKKILFTLSAPIHCVALCVALCAALSLSGCSSAPKRPAEVFTNRNAAAGQLDLGNQAINKGDYANAHIFLGEAWRLALSTDDPATRIKVLLANGNVFFNEGNRDKADEIWAAAQKEAESTGDKSLIGITKIYRARGNLAEGLSSDQTTEADRKTRAEQAKAVVSAELGNVKGDKLYEAFSWKVLGLCEKELGRPKVAISAFEKAASIHEKSRYLEETAYDWYLVASVHSKSGNYVAARNAIKTAMAFDHRAENANGLGMDWMALGMIEEKSGQKDAAIDAYTRSGDIFRAGFLKTSAADADKRRDALANQ